MQPHVVFVDTVTLVAAGSAGGRWALAAVTAESRAGALVGFGAVTGAPNAGKVCVALAGADGPAAHRASRVFVRVEPIGQDIRRSLAHLPNSLLAAVAVALSRDVKATFMAAVGPAGGTKPDGAAPFTAGEPSTSVQPVRNAF
ncbi:hypothetical protein I552_5357 [Mycobacterium xenopi 3993]|nr:hypothetical protein I552_5357 [Mycobacterium xenopi 3993]